MAGPGAPGSGPMPSKTSPVALPNRCRVACGSIVLMPMLPLACVMIESAVVPLLLVYTGIWLVVMVAEIGLSRRGEASGGGGSCPTTELATRRHTARAAERVDMDDQ